MPTKPTSSPQLTLSPTEVDRVSRPSQLTILLHCALLRQALVACTALHALDDQQNSHNRRFNLTSTQHSKRRAEQPIESKKN